MTLGVLGTMVWDRIDHPTGDTIERWGGITYSLAAAAAALPTGWTLRPLIKLGADLADEGRAFLASLPGVEPDAGVREVAEPNNRVHLRYRDEHHRDEHLTGGVPGWDMDELAPLLRGLDGVYVNLISGFELDAATVAALPDTFDAPRYVDLHSLVLGVADDGKRVPRTPPHPETWLAAFHVIQANGAELDVLAGRDGAGTELAHRAVRQGVRAVLVTRGPDGADWFAPSPGAVWSGDDAGAAPALGSSAARAVQAGSVPLDEPWTEGDPTGCGDVWGATCFTRLMQGAALAVAMNAANRAAARNVNHRGADGLYDHLRTTT